VLFFPDATFQARVQDTKPVTVENSTTVDNDTEAWICNTGIR
jgi:hypothetical protein